MRAVDPVVVALREERQRQGLSLRLLGDLSGITPSAICMMETGKNNPRLTTVRAVADALGVALVDGESLIAPPHAKRVYSRDHERDQRTEHRTT